MPARAPSISDSELLGGLPTSPSPPTSIAPLRFEGDRGRGRRGCGERARVAERVFGGLRRRWAEFHSFGVRPKRWPRGGQSLVEARLVPADDRGVRRSWQLGSAQRRSSPRVWTCGSSSQRSVCGTAGERSAYDRGPTTRNGSPVALNFDRPFARAPSILVPGAVGCAPRIQPPLTSIAPVHKSSLDLGLGAVGGAPHIPIAPDLDRPASL